MTVADPWKYVGIETLADPPRKVWQCERCGTFVWGRDDDEVCPGTAKDHSPSCPYAATP